MKFYNSIGPNPKLVRVFAAEKHFELPNVQEVDIMAGENRQGEYLAKNPAAGMPALELDDGQVIAETIAICELIEELQPEPALIGTTAAERAETRMWVRRVEWKIIAPLTDGFRNGEGSALFKDRMRLLPEASDWQKSCARDGLAWLDEQMAGRETIVPGRFTLADVALFAFADFGAQVGQPIDPALKNVNAWFEKIKERPSADA